MIGLQQAESKNKEAEVPGVTDRAEEVDVPDRVNCLTLRRVVDQSTFLSFFLTIL